MSSTTVSVIVGFPGLPEINQSDPSTMKRIARKINDLNIAKFNCVIDVTLNANTGATVIADNRIGYNSAVTPLMPMTPSGATAVAAGIWCAGVTSRVAATTASITVHHASAAATDQKIRFGIFG